MTAKNDITGDSIQTKPSTEAYRTSPYWDKEVEVIVEEEEEDGE
jgi:hypothetical protein